MLGLTTLGTIHTAISLVAVFAGYAMLVRDRQIVAASPLGQVYIWTTVLTCLTGFGIFQHGGFGKPHVLGIVTLVTLAVAAVAGRTQLFGAASRYVETLSYTATLFFHMVPAITETSTRLPLGKPWIASAESPELQPIVGGTFVVFLVIAGLQVWKLRGTPRGMHATP